KPNWDLWSYYAKRVRSLEIFDVAPRRDRDSFINPEVGIYLLSSFNEWSRPGERLMPNIKKLGLQCYLPSTLSLALLFIAPSLKFLKFFILDSSSEVLRSVRNLLISLNAMRDAVQIQNVTIHYEEPQEGGAEFERALIDFLGSQPTISTFAFSTVGSRTLLAKMIKAMPSLKELALAGSFSAAEEEVRAEIQIIVDNARDLEDFSYYGMQEDGTIGSVLFSIPAPLFQFSNLKSLVLGSLIENMGRSWPGMEYLELLPRADLQDGRGIAPGDLIHFAAAFSPTLRYLAITINFSDAVSLAIPQSFSRFLKLETLDVGLSAITKQNIRPFTELLNKLTTYNVSIEHSHEDGTEQAENWEQTSKLLSVVNRSTAMLVGTA
ncbi:hypothetical protein FRC01_003524, partial [Tulasnella sp. 417]